MRAQGFGGVPEDWVAPAVVVGERGLDDTDDSDDEFFKGCFDGAEVITDPSEVARAAAEAQRERKEAYNSFLEEKLVAAKERRQDILARMRLFVGRHDHLRWCKWYCDQCNIVGEQIPEGLKPCPAPHAGREQPDDGRIGPSPKKLARVDGAHVVVSRPWWADEVAIDEPTATADDEDGFAELVMGLEQELARRTPIMTGTQDELAETDEDLAETEQDSSDSETVASNATPATQRS